MTTDKSSTWKWVYDESYKVWDLKDESEVRIAFLQQRPSYCDRGHWLGNIEIECNLDGADLWPNYYMSLDRAKEEIIDFLRWRLYKVSDHQVNNEQRRKSVSANIRSINCKCGNWEELPEDQNRSHVTEFEWVRDNIYLCNHCKSYVDSTINTNTEEDRQCEGIGVSELYNRALAFATKAHAGQVRKNLVRCHTNCPEEYIPGNGCTVCGGSGWMRPDYITHPIAVSELAMKYWVQYSGDEVLAKGTQLIGVTALFHDIVEDCPKYPTVASITAEFGDEFLEDTLSYLTHTPKDLPYFDYIMYIANAGTLEAQFIKIADITHNLSTWPEKKSSMRDKWELARELLVSSLYDDENIFNKGYE